MDMNEQAQQEMMGGMPPQKELTPEEKEAQKKATKEAEIKRIEEQIASLKVNLVQQDVALKVKEAYLKRVAANIDVLKNVDLEDAKTEWNKKAAHAEIEEAEAILELETLNFEAGKDARANFAKQLNDLRVNDLLEE